MVPTNGIQLSTFRELAALPPSLPKALGFPADHLKFAREAQPHAQFVGKSIGKPEAYRKGSGRAAVAGGLCKGPYAMNTKTI